MSCCIFFVHPSKLNDVSSFFTANNIIKIWQCDKPMIHFAIDTIKICRSRGLRTYHKPNTKIGTSCNSGDTSEFGIARGGDGGNCQSILGWWRGGGGGGIAVFSLLRHLGGKGICHLGHYNFFAWLTKTVWVFIENTSLEHSFSGVGWILYSIIWFGDASHGSIYS